MSDKPKIQVPFSAVASWFLRGEVDRTAKLLYAVLASYAVNAARECRARRQDLAAALGVTPRYVTQLLEILVGVGVIEIRRTNTGNVYKLLAEHQGQPPETADVSEGKSSSPGADEVNPASHPMGNGVHIRCEPEFTSDVNQSSHRKLYREEQKKAEAAAPAATANLLDELTAAAKTLHGAAVIEINLAGRIMAERDLYAAGLDAESCAAFVAYLSASPKQFLQNAARNLRLLLPDVKSLVAEWKSACAAENAKKDTRNARETPAGNNGHAMPNVTESRPPTEEDIRAKYLDGLRCGFPAESQREHLRIAPKTLAAWREIESFRDEEGEALLAGSRRRSKLRFVTALAEEKRAEAVAASARGVKP